LLSGEYELRLYWAPSFMRAVQDQLGLRLEAKKSVVEFLVVDHAEKIPAVN